MTTPRYQMGPVLGRGGMATVYRAVDTAADQPVAIKILEARLAEDAGMVEAFQREAAMMQSLEHPGIVRVFTSTEIDGQPAIVMELLEGGELRDVLLREGAFTERRALDVVIPVLDALHAAHEAGVIHRDVKPHNVVFDAAGAPKLIDFGIGQAEELMEADDAGHVGTVEYMAPERVDGFAVDARSDIYSAGIMLFELVCGHVPYRADSGAAVMRMHRQAEIPDPKLFQPEITYRLARAIQRALAKHPEDRFPSAEAFRDALTGDDEILEPIGDHRDWERLVADLDAPPSLAAAVDGDDGYEWVVYSPRLPLDDSPRHARQVEAMDAVVSDFPDSRRWRGIVAKVSHSTHTMAHHDPYNSGSFTPRYHSIHDIGLARGLSREGVEEIVHRLEAHGGTAEFCRRPRKSSVQWMRLLPRDLRTNLILIYLAFVVGSFFLPILSVFLATAEYLESSLISTITLLFIPVVVCFGVGLWTVYIAALGWLREAWLPFISTNYLLDFADHRHVPPDVAPLTVDHLKVADEIQSPRVAHSFRRAIHMVLHLRDALSDDNNNLNELHDTISSVEQWARQIIDLETRVAQTPATRLAHQIARIDRRLEAAEDVHDLDDLMAEKSDLRRQIQERDEAQQQLQSLAQRLLDRSTELEVAVRQAR